MAQDINLKRLLEEVAHRVVERVGEAYPAWARGGEVARRQEGVLVAAARAAWANGEREAQELTVVGDGVQAHLEARVERGVVVGRPWASADPVESADRRPLEQHGPARLRRLAVDALEVAGVKHGRVPSCRAPSSLFRLMSWAN